MESKAGTVYVDSDRGQEQQNLDVADNQAKNAIS